MNFLTETLRAIRQSDHKPSDIAYIGDNKQEYSTTFHSFALLANYEYAPARPPQTVAHDLVIVFTDNTKLYRQYRNDTEWWAYDAPITANPDTLPDTLPITSLFSTIGNEPLFCIN